MAKVMTHVVVTLQFRLPRWWRLYVGALQFFAWAGLLDVDADAAAEFLTRHCKTRLGKGRWQRFRHGAHGR